MGQRQAVIRQSATRYRSASKTGKAAISDELCALTACHRDPQGVAAALRPKHVVRQRKSCQPVYGPEVIAALTFCWAVMGGPAGKRMAPFLPEIVDRLRACGELTITDAVADQLAGISAATIDRRLADERKKLQVNAVALAGDAAARGS
ncbi:hypothetical protein ACWDKQ_13605 [Saccharopolyspora sp. NPDC000995]